MKPIHFQAFLFQINNLFHVSLSTGSFIEIFSSIQIIHLIFFSMNAFSSNSQFIILSLNKNLSFLTGAFPLHETSIYNSMLKSIWIVILIYFIAHFLLFLGISKAFLRKDQTHAFLRRIIKILSWAYLFHSRIIFFPIQFFLLNLCQLYNNSSPNGQFYQKTGWLIGSIILIMVNSGLAICKEFLMYQVNHTENLYSVKTNIYHQMMLLYKMAALSLYFWGITSTFKALQGVTVLHLLFGFILMSLLYLKLPFYQFKMLKLVVSLTAVKLCLAAVSVIYVFVEDHRKTAGAMHILVLILPSLGIKVVLAQFRRLFKRILQGEYLTRSQAIHFGVLFEDFMIREKNKGSEDWSFLPNREIYYGVLGERISHLGTLKLKQTNTQGESEIYLHITEKLGLELSQYPKSRGLALYLAQIYLMKIENIPKALEIIRKLETTSKNRLSIPMKNSIEYVDLSLRRASKEDGSGDQGEFFSYFKYFDVTNDIKALMLLETNKQLEFWQDLEKQELDVKRIYDKVEEIDLLFVQIRKKCELNLNNFRKNFRSSMLLYSVYLRNVRHMFYDGAQILRSFQSVMLAHQNHELDAASGNTAVLVISLDKAKAGTILNVSGAIHNIFNFKKTDVIGKKIGCLFPITVAKCYQQDINGFAKAPMHKLDYKEKTYGKTSNDEIFELEVHLQLYPYVNKELTMMMKLRKLEEPAPVLIVNSEGLIIDCSETLRAIFQEESLNLKNFQGLQNLSMELEEANLAFNLVYNNQQPQETQKSMAVNFDNSAVDFDLSSRHTSCSLLTAVDNTDRGGKNQKLRMSQNRVSAVAVNKEISIEKAQRICKEFIEGKETVLKPNSESTPFQKRLKISAQVKIQPYVVKEGEVYKIIRFTNLKRVKDMTVANSGHQSFENITSSDQDQDPAFETFGDEFPAYNEKIIIKAVTLKKGKKEKSSDKDEKRSKILKSESNGEDDNESNQSHARTTQRKNMILELQLQENHDDDDQKSSIMHSTHHESRTVKTLRHIGSSKKLQRGLGSLQILVYLIIFMMLILAFVKFDLSRGSIEEIEKGVTIINLATLRLQNVINSWLWSLVLVAGGNFTTVTANIQTNTKKLSYYSSQLEAELGTIKDRTWIERAFEKDVTFFNVAIQGENHEKEIDTFLATNVLLTKYLEIQNCENLLQVKMIPELSQIFNNTSNDYIISSNEMITATITILDDIIEKDILLLDIVLSIKMVALAGLIAVFIIMGFLISKSYQKLARALLRTKTSAVKYRISQLNKFKVLLEDDIERKGFIQYAFDLLIEPSQLQMNPKNPHKAQKVAIPNMLSMNKYLLRILFKAFMFIPLLIVLFVVTQQKSVHTFNSLGSVNEGLSMLSYGCFQSSFLMSTLIYGNVFGTQATMLVNNQAPALQAKENFNNFNNLNPKLIETFMTSSKKKEIDPFLVEVLQTDVCKYLDGTTRVRCDTATSSQKTGLLSVNTDYYNTLLNVYTSIGPTTTLLEAIKMFSQILGKITGSMFAMENIYPVMISHILEEFRVTVQSSKKNEVTFVVIMCVTVVIYAVFIYVKPLKDLKRVDIGRRKILKIIPFGVLQENKAIKFYLLQDFKTEVEEIKNTL